MIARRFLEAQRLLEPCPKKAPTISKPTSCEAKKGHLYDRENPFAIPAADRFLHGNCLYRLGRRDEALVQYRLAIQADPTHANAWNNLIALLLETRDLPSARVELTQAEADHVAIQPGPREAVLGISPR